MRIVELAGGVGGARMARGLAGLDEVDLTVIVNVGDDADNHGLRISPDIDTILYTLAGIEGPFGWGRADDTFTTNTELARFGLDNTFRLGDKDLALKIYRTHRMSGGESLSTVVTDLAARLGIRANVLPATDDEVRTMVRIDDDEWITFQEYFVVRKTQDEVLELRYAGAEDSRPAPGVLEAIEAAELVVIAPSNPPLSIWPVLATESIAEAVRAHPRVIAVSPLIDGKPVKGPADRVMASLGLPAGNRGVARAYEGLIDTLVIDSKDAEDTGSPVGLKVMATDTLIKEPAAGVRLAREIVES